MVSCWRRDGWVLYGWFAYTITELLHNQERDYKINVAISPPNRRHHTAFTDAIKYSFVVQTKNNGMPTVQKVTTNLWFDNEAEEAARFYTSVFKNSKIGKMARYGKEGFEIHQRPEGSVMTIEFELEGQQFLGLNGGPVFKFNESVSLMSARNLRS